MSVSMNIIADSTEKNTVGGDEPGHTFGDLKHVSSNVFDVNTAIEELQNFTDQEKGIREPSPLCKQCQYLIEQATKKVLGKRKHHRDWAAVTKSAQQGCGLCALLGRRSLTVSPTPEYLKLIGKEPPLEGIAELHFDLSHHFFTFPDYAETLGWSHEERLEPASLYHQCVINIVATPTPALQYDCLNDSTLNGLPLLKHWLRGCQKSHNTCRSKDKNFIPTRLIDIGRDKPRLQLGQSLKQGIQYVALSHCWGSLKYLRLTTETLDDFQTLIPPEALPKTFEHAIAISRYLGFSHIWIDSLCILQDSPEDWERECTLMMEVYGTCELNIAATAAEDASVGCFFERNPDWRCQVRTNSTKEPLFECHSAWEFGIHRNPLRRRAWDIQERYLSRRTIHFAEDQLFWECSENPACEIFPFGYSPSVKDNWPQTVFMYSGGALTRSSDKLLAIGGLAKKIQSQTEDVYVVGLWRSKIEEQLWWVSVESKPAQRYVPYVAPTWSWASFSGAVEYVMSTTSFDINHSKEHLCILVRDVSIQYISDDTFGGVESAHLRIQCRYLFEGMVERKSNRETYLHFGKHKVSSVMVWHDYESRYVEHVSYSTALFLPIYYRGAESVEGGEGSRGILFERTHNASGEYRRIGAYWVANARSFSEAAGDLNLLGQDGDGHFSEISLGPDGTRQYFIDLV
ncbi:heterokaryon incompatibility protein-domain-containing protein [Lophiotrema nucula]|uniref:Heterokaryon incompatibility protein-domain-containing protein n=1 Tax=Lophiotrema nucula TaxID=690887 RepID=A0A6A5Z3X2_9PLEO|nr:heterokaryon incompatibility protein-domain-containing protein [Lophiotrema nucula]